MTDDDNVNEVRKELDVLAMRMLDLMKQYIDLKLVIEDFIKTGSLHLAKSRYIMGNKSVSVLQLPTEESELNAQTKVIGNDSDVSSLKLELSKMSLNENNLKNSKDVNSQEDGLKRRKATKEDDAEGKSNEKTTREDTKDEPNTSPKKKDVMQDPLKWFGVLVPQNMRLAQSSFNKAIETSVDLANIQLEMSAVREKYVSLLIKKKELLSQSNAIPE